MHLLQKSPLVSAPHDFSVLASGLVSSVKVRGLSAKRQLGSTSITATNTAESIDRSSLGGSSAEVKATRVRHLRGRNRISRLAPVQTRRRRAANASPLSDAVPRRPNRRSAGRELIKQS